MHNITTNINKTGQTLFLYIAVAAMLFLSFQAIFLPLTANAAQLTERKLTLSSSSPASSNAATTYTFDFITATTATFQSFSAQLCTTASGACSAPTGFDEASSTLTSDNLSGTWSVSTATNNELRASATGAASTPASTASQIVFGNVQNPTTTNTTFFARMTLYSAANWTSAVDTGVVAASTATVINLSATVDESLTFCAAASGIGTTNCSGATGSDVTMLTAASGNVSASASAYGTSMLGVGTNGTTGYAVTINGSTLTYGTDTISALASQTASSAGTEQFGLNLKDNATPDVGAEPGGSGSATPTANYGTADQYRFVTGDSIASYTGPDVFKQFTVSYMANITTATEAGTYQSAMTYIATATF
jgi:hypothetical protein